MENISDLLLEAANLLAVGMVVVFAFLTLLIFCIKLMSKFAGGEVEAPVNQVKRRPVTQKQSNAGQITAAISAAIHQHRQK